MPTDINTLCYEELVELKIAIERRLKELESLNPEKNIRGIGIGDTVSFNHATLGTQTGTLIQLNGETAIVTSKSGQRWSVASHLLRKVVRQNSTGKKRGKLIVFPEK